METLLHIAVSPQVVDGALSEEWWASTDGYHWLPCDRKPEAGDYATIVAWFAPESRIEDGRAVTMHRITYVTRYVRASWGGAAIILPPLAVAP
jgi:hypothetical protein